MEDRIAIDPAVCNGRPVIRDTQITAQTALEFLGAGDSIEDVLEEYPTLTRDDVLACLCSSSRLVRNHFVIEKVEKRDYPPRERSYPVGFSDISANHRGFSLC